MTKKKNHDGAAQAAAKEDLTMVRDMVNTLRDDFPDIDDEVATTANERRALRKAIYKAMSVWLKMYQHSELPADVIQHRVTSIGKMMATILTLRQVPEEEDGDTDEEWNS